MDLKLKGKKAIITGASRGVGRAIALGLAAEGVDLVLGLTRLEGVEAVAAEAREMGVIATAIAVDVGDAEDVRRFMEAAHRALGQMDILVNDAGIFLQGWCQDIPLEDWQRTLDVNLTGAFLTSQSFAQANLAAGRPGKIININSQAAFHGSTTGHVHYAASKAAMTAMTISMARELSPMASPSTAWPWASWRPTWSARASKTVPATMKAASPSAASPSPKKSPASSSSWPPPPHPTSLAPPSTQLAAC